MISIALPPFKIESREVQITKRSFWGSGIGQLVYVILDSFFPDSNLGVYFLLSSSFVEGLKNAHPDFENYNYWTGRNYMIWSFQTATYTASLCHRKVAKVLNP